MSSSDATVDANPSATGIGTRGILTALCATFGTALYAFTWNSVTVALPHMQGTFSATTDQIAWVMIAFIIGSAVMTACVGWLSDRFGRKKLFLLTIAGYTLTLLGCGSATTIEEMTFWRFLQGTFGAGLIPLGQIIAVNAFPPDRHGQATSLWALGFVTSNVIAPTIAGLVVEDFGWPWIFYFPLPVGVVVFFAAWYLVPDTEKNPRPLDWLGFSSLIIGIIALQFALARGERLDWLDSTEIIVELSVAALALYIFVTHTFTGSRTFIERSLFHDRDFSLGLVFIFMIGAVLFLPLFLLPLILQQISGYSAIDTGYLMLSRGVGSVISLYIMSKFRDSTDPRPWLIVGLGMTAYSSWMIAHWSVDIRAADVVLANFLHGLATGAVWAPLNTLTLSRLKPRQQDQGFAVFYLSFDIGSAIGTALIIGLHARHSQINHAVLAERITHYSELARVPPLSSIWSLRDLRGLATLEEEVARQATMIAFNNSFLIISGVLLTLLPLILLFKHRGARNQRA